MIDPTYIWIGTVLIALIGYMVGSISFAIIISKKVFHNDVRQYFSKNAGATNMARVFGKKIGFLVFILDILKVAVVMSIAYGITKIPAINGSNSTVFKCASIYLGGFFAVIGHTFPVYYHFKGGKGVACYLGFLLLLDPYYFIIGFATFWIIFFVTKIVSLSSLSITVLIFGLSWINPLHLYFLSPCETGGSYWPWWWINLLLGALLVFIFFTHRANIKRMLKWKEPKFKSFKYDKN